MVSMDVESRRLREDRAVPVTPVGKTRLAGRSRVKAGVIGLLVAALTGTVLAGCTPTGQSSTMTESASTYNEDGVDMDSGESDRATGRADTRGNGDSGGSTQDVSFRKLATDPESLVGSRIRVTGNVFFHSVCPPPGATDSTCVLLGYLTDPDRRTFIAADEADAIALAEDGVRLSCEEGGDSSRACAGWSAASTYTLEGVLEHQVLGGRVTELVQLDVEAKSAPQPW